MSYKDCCIVEPDSCPHLQQYHCTVQKSAWHGPGWISYPWRIKAVLKLSRGERSGPTAQGLSRKSGLQELTGKEREVFYPSAAWRHELGNLPHAALSRSSPRLLRGCMLRHMVCELAMEKAAAGPALSLCACGEGRMERSSCDIHCGYVKFYRLYWIFFCTLNR